MYRLCCINLFSNLIYPPPPRGDYACEKALDYCPPWAINRALSTLFNFNNVKITVGDTAQKVDILASSIVHRCN